MNESDHKASSEFYAGLCDAHLQTQEFMQKELRRLRLENEWLRRKIREVPCALTELQDRVTMLEGMLP